MTPYAQLSVRSQVDRLRLLARDVCRLYGFPDARLRLLNHGFNTTFQVTAEGQRYALRLNTNSHRSPAELAAEVAWVRALAAETELPVPRPIANVEGDFISRVPAEVLGREVAAVMFSWMPGRLGDAVPSATIGERVGAATAILHRHAAQWRPPAGAALTAANSIMGTRAIELPAGVDVGVYREVAARGDAILGRLGPSRIPLHYDLHLANVKWHQGRLSVFDFDDSRTGHPVQDAAITVFYLRRYEGGLDDAYWRGLGRSCEDLSVTPTEFETLVAGRGAYLANELAAMTTANWVARAPEYARVFETRLRHYLVTGRYDPTVARFGS